MKNSKTAKKLRTEKERAGGDEELDDALFTWFKQKLAQSARLSGPEIKAKAIQLAELKGVENFQASQEWLWRWKSRFQMVFKKQQGEKLDANSTSANDWIHDVLPGILEKFNPADIFNADETGLFFRAFKDKGYCLSNGELSGGKTAKERITFLLCANLNGSGKLPLLVIGKSCKPR